MRIERKGECKYEKQGNTKAMAQERNNKGGMQEYGFSCSRKRGGI